MRPVRLRVSVSGGNWLWWSLLSHSLHGLFGSTPNYGRRLPNGPRSSTPKGGGGRVAYEGRCVWWRAALLVCGAEATLSQRRLWRINLDLRTQRAWFTKTADGESESNRLHTQVCVWWVICWGCAVTEEQTQINSDSWNNFAVCNTQKHFIFHIYFICHIK